MEKKITDDHRRQPLSSSSGDSRPSLKIRIRLTPEMMKQWRHEEEEEKEAASSKELQEKSAKEEAVKELDVIKSEELIEVHQVKQQLVDCSSSSSSSFQLKFEATKRKLHDSYQQLANAKRQRRIQVIDPWNLPQQAQGKGTSKLASCGGAKSRLNVILSKNKKKKNNNNLLSVSRSKLLKPSYVC